MSIYGHDYPEAEDYDPSTEPGYEPVGDPYTADDEQLERQLWFNRRVSEEADKIRVREAARALIEQERRGDRPTIEAVDGDTFILNQPTGVPAVWGHGEDVAWAEGEPLTICGLPGTGKTTIAGQLLRARLGLGDGNVLGMPVTATSSRVLYLAMDRPRQIARALGRLFTDVDQDVLADRLRFWPGPPPADLALDTDTLAQLAYDHGADTVVVDSIKDAFLGVSEDGPASAYNRARQTAIAAGVEILELHHMRKTGTGGGKPEHLSDVYGSTWITAGAGSVIALNGEPGDPLVELRHLKQPSAVIGPWKVLHDSVTGLSGIFHSTDFVALARAHGEISAKGAAKALTESDKPTANDVEKARRRLDALVRSGHLEVTREGNQALNLATLWGPAESVSTGALETFTHPFTGGFARETFTTPSQPSQLNSPHAENDPHGDLHDLHAPRPSRSLPPLIGGESESATTETPTEDPETGHTCTVCQTALDPALSACGETTHPGCDAHQEAS